MPYKQLSYDDDPDVQGVLNAHKSKMMCYCGCMMVCILTAVIGITVGISNAVSARRIRGVSDMQTLCPMTQTLLDKHNTYRALHSSPPLVWDDDLARDAGGWLSLCKFGHGDEVMSEKGQGENLFSGGTGWEILPLVTGATDGWYKEIEDYDIATATVIRGSPFHFTQVVWKSTTRIGCAANKCSSIEGLGSTYNNGVIVSCRYYPAGNMQGQWLTNVLPRKNTA